MSDFGVILVILALPSLAFADACDISIEGVTEHSTRDEVIAAWSETGLERVENPLSSRKMFNKPDVVVAFRFPPYSDKLTELLHLRWERYNDRGILKITASYRPDMPRESGISKMMEKWSLWPMIADRKKQCAGAADLRNQAATLRCQDEPGHFVVDRRERAYEVKQGQPPRQHVYTEYACKYQFNAGPGPFITEKFEVIL